MPGISATVGKTGQTITMVAAIAVAAALTWTVTGGSGGGLTANLWVDANGGTCTRQATPATYTDAAACSGPATAWNAATSGDTIRVKNGTYTGLQNFTSDKTAETLIIGESREGVILQHTGTETDCGGNGFGFDTGPFCFNGNHMTFQDFTLDSQAQHGASSAGRVGGQNVHFTDLHVKGTYPSLWTASGATGFVWDGGIFGENGVQGQRHCSVGDGEPFQFEEDGGTLRNVYFFPQGSDQTPHACSSNGFHLETIRVQDADAITLENVTFADGAEAGSGHVFLSGTGACCNHTFRNVYFGEMSDGTTSMQANANLGTCSNWTFQYVTMEQGAGLDCTESGHSWTGSAGEIGCNGTHVKNVRVGTGTCGTDTNIANAAAMNLSATGVPNAGSPLIDAAQATCTAVSPDALGIVRPQGSACDAGAFEVTP